MTWIDEFVECVFPLDATKLKIEDGFALKYSNLPKSLFKYRSVDSNSLKNLQEDTVWLADPKSFNDPYDCHHFIDYKKAMDVSFRKITPEIRALLSPEDAERVKELLATADDPTEVLIDALLNDEDPVRLAALKSGVNAGRMKLYEKMAKDGDNLKAGFRLCSFSARVDSTLMWSHYSSNHTGFCIEYDVTSLPPADLRSRFMFPVIYQDDVFDVTDCMQSVGTPQFNNIRLNLAALVKVTDWSYEREWRLVFANGMIKHPQPYQMPLAKSVYLGSHISSENESLIKQICADKGIALFKMKHSRSHYVMTPGPL